MSDQLEPVTRPSAPAWSERLTKALIEAWVKHKSTKPGEWGDPDNVFYSVRRAVEVIAPIVSAELARLTAAVEAAQWQPIETAPKTSREILLTDLRSYKRTGYWAHRVERWSVDSAVSLPPPTHWMPLPSRPLEAERATGEGTRP